MQQHWRCSAGPDHPRTTNARPTAGVNFFDTAEGYGSGGTSGGRGIAGPGMPLAPASRSHGRLTTSPVLLLPLLPPASERALGLALKKLGVPRSAYVVASKVNNSNLTGDKLVEACDRSLANLGLTYLDLYQVCHP